MWIGQAEVGALEVFISGFRAGLGAAHVSLDDERPPFRDSHEWIADRLGRRMNGRGWRMMLLEECADEAAAWERFWIELDAFRRGRV
jgi:hypothetical protein